MNNKESNIAETLPLNESILLGEILMKEWQVEDIDELQLAITLNPCVLRIQKCMLLYKSSLEPKEEGKDSEINGKNLQLKQHNEILRKQNDQLRTEIEAEKKKAGDSFRNYFEVLKGYTERIKELEAMVEPGK